MMLPSSIVLTIFAVVAQSVPLTSDGFELSIVHVNDFHARFEEIHPKVGVCKRKNSSCVGGFSRMYSVIKQLVKNRPDSIVLNGADNFQGSLWYSIYRWNVTQYFLNLLPFDAYTLGNHEFDHGIEGLIPFITSLNAPVVVSNIDDSKEPRIQGLYNRSIIVERNGRRIGIIGVIKKNTNHLSNTGELKFFDESSSVNHEANKLIEKVDTIIVLSHCGYETDKIIARNAVSKISVVVGAHSHTFLYTGDSPIGPEIPEGPYPTVVRRSDGKNVLIVHAAAHSRYVGNLTVQFDKEGNVISWSGAPIYLNNHILEDKDINRQLEEWKSGLEIQEQNIIGSSKVFLMQNDCQRAECNLGNFVADAMISAYSKTDADGWPSASIAVMNSGGLKMSIPPGNVTYSNLLLTLPYSNTFDLGEISGKHLKEALEYASEKENLLQVSGIRIVYNMSNPLGSRIHSVKLRCRKCEMTEYDDLQLEDKYRIVLNSFLAAGGDGNEIFAKNLISRKNGKTDIDVLEKYIVMNSPITHELQGRIKFVY